MTAAPVPAPPIRINSLDQLIIEVVPEYIDAYEKRPPVAIKIFAVRHTSTTCRVGIRQGERRAEAVLDPDQIRLLAEHLHDCADLIDPPKTGGPTWNG